MISLALSTEVMKFHEAANIFPLLQANELDALTEDIRKNGLQEPIKLLDGLIIDGRNRYRACVACGCKPKFEDVKPVDPVAFVMSLNLHRRHMNKGELALCANRAREYYDKEARERQVRKPSDSVVGNLPPQNLSPGKSRDKAGAAFGVSGSSVDQARNILTKGVPELVKAVEQGSIGIRRASDLTKESHDVQRKVIDDRRAAIEDRKTTVAPKRVRRDRPDPVVEGEYRKYTPTCVHYANFAILQLQRIDLKDKDREVAFQMIEDWIKKARETKTK